MKNSIEIQEIKHKNEWRYFLFYDYTTELNNLVRGLSKAKYSATHKTWHLPLTEESKTTLRDFAKQNPFIQLKKKNIEKDKNNSIEIKPLPNESKNTTQITLPNLLTGEQITKVENFKRWMASKRYSNNTINTYTEALKLFLKFYSHKPITDITNDDVISFNNDYIIAKHLSASFQNQTVNAIKLFFVTIENKQIKLELIHRPKREKTLPNVLSKEEVKQLLNAHSNIKHKTMLSLIYACGLRCGELLKLKPEHIDSKRHVLIIKNGKGKKDRITPLGETAIEMLRNYFIIYKPTIYLFEGQIKSTMYDERSLQQVLKQAVAKTKISKPVTLHWLRHSYATHLLENGTDLRYIQEILGHSSSRTTEIYTHVSTKSIQNIISPFDYL